MKGKASRKLDLQRSVVVLLNFLSNRLTASGSAIYRAKFGLSIMEFRLLVMLASEPDIAPSRICEVMGLDMGAVSRGLRALQERKLVLNRSDARHPSYRLWSLTIAGARLQDEAVLVALERDSILLEDIAEQERDLLISILRRMLARVDGLG